MATRPPHPKPKRLVKPTKRIGVLEHDAPGFNKSMEQLMPPKELERVQRAYAMAVRHGALYELGVRRGANDSYNPKPARLCQIMMGELKEERAPCLISAMLACVPVDALALLSPEFQAEIAVAAEVHALVTYPESPMRTLTGERVFLALVIDELRHLHMMDLAPQQRHELYERTKKIITPRVGFTENERLRRMLESRLSLLERTNRV